MHNDEGAARERHTTTPGFTVNSQPSKTPDPAKQAEFAQLFAGNERRIKGYVLSLVPNWADAEEIFAETNFRLWDQFDQFDRSKDFGAWACAIAHYEVLTFRRQQQREKLRFSDSDLAVVAGAVHEADNDRHVRQRFLNKCLDTLDAKSRQLIRDFYAGIETVDQIAQRTGSSRAAVYKSVSRGRHRLHTCIDSHLREDEQS